MATTGTQSSGSDFVGLADAMKHTYTGPFENNIEKESEVQDIFAAAEGFEVHEGSDGKQINLGHIFSSGGGVAAMGEDDYLIGATVPNTKQSSLTIKQLTATEQLSGRTLRRVRQGPAAFATWADEALPRKAQRVAFHLDRMLIGTGTGIIARVNDASPATTDTGIDSAYGIAGLEGAVNLLLEGDSTRWSPNANGSSPRTGAAVLSTAPDYDNNEIDIAAVPTSGADNDYIFLGDANVISNAKEVMGLEGIVDDGTNVATFQGLARASYARMKGQVIDSSSASLGFGATLSEDLLDYADSLAWERAGGRPSVILCNRSGQRSFWKSLKGDRTINDPAGSFVGGKASLRMILGDRVVAVKAARKVPSSRAYLLDTSTLHKFQIGSGRWDDTDGSVWNRVVDGTGRKDAFFAVWVQELEVGCSDPARNVKITNLAAA